MIRQAISFHMRLVSYRKSKNITRRQLSKLSGVPYSTLSEYETGKVEPSARAFYRIADALLIRPRWLMEGEEPGIALTEAEYGPEFVYLAFRDPTSMTESRVIKNLRVLLAEAKRRGLKIPPT